jgi:hypothetical protein
VKVCEICIYLQNPVWLYKYYSADVYQRHSAGEKRFVLDPRDDVVQRPGGVEEDGTDGQPPVVDGSIEEDEEAMPDAEDKLQSRSETARSLVQEI